MYIWKKRVIVMRGECSDVECVCKILKYKKNVWKNLLRVLFSSLSLSARTLQTWFATTSHLRLRLHLFISFFPFNSDAMLRVIHTRWCAEEKKSVISNFLIVIVCYFIFCILLIVLCIVFDCVAFLWFIYEIYVSSLSLCTSFNCRWTFNWYIFVCTYY